MSDKDKDARPWDERAAEAMSTVLEAEDKGDLAAFNEVLLTMESLLRERDEKKK